jgi:3-methyladenine DNA glycosylase AlkD
LLSTQEVLSQLKSKSKPDRLEGMTHYGMNIKQRFGISIPELRAIAKTIGKDHQLALNLWKTGIAEAKFHAAIIDDPELLSDKQMKTCVKDIDSWDIGDQVGMNLFEKTPHA